MARVTSAELALIFPAGPSDDELAAAIDDASAWVDAFLVGACTSMTDALLTLIEKYLAADLLTVKYPPLKSRKILEESESYAAAGTDGVSQYLRKAAALDPCGVVQAQLVDVDKPRGKFHVMAGYDPDHTGGGN